MKTSLMQFIMRSRFVSQRLIFCIDVALSVGATLLAFWLLTFLFPREYSSAALLGLCLHYSCLFGFFLLGFPYL